MCAIAHGCATVQKSDYAKLAGVPVALLGVLGYVGILAALIARRRERAHRRRRSCRIVGLGFSGWLTYVEVVELDAICIWCVGSAICMTLLAGADRLARAHGVSAGARSRALITSAVPASSNASAGTASAGGVSPSATAAISARRGTVNSVASETIVGLIERSTRLNSECPSSWPVTVSAAIRTQSAAA